MEKSHVHRHVGRRRAEAVKAVDAGTATFTQWFEAQYGPPPLRRPLEEARQELHDAAGALQALQLRVTAQERYDEMRDTALKAWQAREDLIRRNLAAQAGR